MNTQTLTSPIFVFIDEVTFRRRKGIPKGVNSVLVELTGEYDLDNEDECQSAMNNAETKVYDRLGQEMSDWMTPQIFATREEAVTWIETNADEENCIEI